MMPLSDQTNTIIRQDLELCLNFVQEYFKNDYETCRKIIFFLKNETKFPTTQVSQILGNTPVRNYLYNIIKNGQSQISLPGTGEIISMQQVLEEHNIGKKHALKKYDQFALNTSCFWGSTGSVVQFPEIFVTKIMNKLIY